MCGDGIQRLELVQTIPRNTPRDRYDGQLLQVQYAQEAVIRGSPVVGVKGPNVIVLAVEQRTVPLLQEERPEKKIVALDGHVMVAFAGLRADARVMITKARMECQSHKLTLEDPVSVEYIARYMAEVKQSYTQSNGRRPFGVCCLVAGFDYDGSAHLFQTEPSGSYYEWKACSSGRGEKTAREFLETHYSDNVVSTDGGAIKLAIRTLLEVVQSAKNKLDVAVMKRSSPVKFLTQDEIKSYTSIIAKEKEEETNK